MVKLRAYRSDIILLLVLAILFLIQLPLYWTDLSVRDEYDFVNGLSDHLIEVGLKGIFFYENSFGYGGLFWILLDLLKMGFGPQATAVFRLLVLSAYLLAISFVFRKQSSPWRWIFLVVLATAPPFWWYGKIVSPEGLIVGAGLIGLALVDQEKSKCRSFLGWSLLGLCLGLKAFGVVFLVYATILKMKKINWRAVGLTLASLFFGYTLANPFIFLNPGIVFNSAKMQAAGLPSDFLQFLNRIFLESIWTWDLVHCGPVIGWLFSSLEFIAIAILILAFSNWRNALGWVMAFVTTLGMILMIGRGHSWYWFPFFFVTAYAFLKIRLKHWAVLGAFGAIHLAHALPISIEHASRQKQFVKQYENTHNVATCLRNNFGSQIVKSDQILRVQPRMPLLETFDADLFANKKMPTAYYASSWFQQPEERIRLEKTPVLALVDEAYFEIGTLTPWEQTIKRVNEAGFTVEKLGECGHVWIFRIDH